MFLDDQTCFWNPWNSCSFMQMFKAHLPKLTKLFLRLISIKDNNFGSNLHEGGDEFWKNKHGFFGNMLIYKNLFQFFNRCHGLEDSNGSLNHILQKIPRFNFFYFIKTAKCELMVIQISKCQKALAKSIHVSDNCWQIAPIRS